MQKACETKFSQMDIFWAAVSYFSRLPVPRGFLPDEAVLARAIRFLPVVGLLVGTLGAVLMWLGAQLWPHPLAVLIAMSAMIWLTGALHEDGWADCCDAFANTSDRERRLEIMRDPRLGSFGVLGLVLMVLAKAVALSMLGLDLQWAMLALIGAQVTSRALPVVVMCVLSYVRPGQQTRAGALVAHTVRTEDVLLALFCGFLPILVWAVLNPWLMLKVVFLLCLVTVGWIAVLRNKLGGYNGDALGAMQQLGELACYMGLLL